MGGWTRRTGYHDGSSRRSPRRRSCSSSCSTWRRSRHCSPKRCAVDDVGDVLGRRRTWEVVWFTTWQATRQHGLTLVVGIAPAYVLARFRFVGRRLLLGLLTAAFVLPTVVMGAAFSALLPDSLDRSIWAILGAHVVFNLAVVVRTVGAVWEHLPPDLEAAAATLGASPVARVPRDHPSAAAAGAHRRRRDRVPVHVHVVRRDPHPRDRRPGRRSRSRSGGGRRSSARSARRPSSPSPSSPPSASSWAGRRTASGATASPSRCGHSRRRAGACVGVASASSSVSPRSPPRRSSRSRCSRSSSVRCAPTTVTRCGRGAASGTPRSDAASASASTHSAALWPFRPDRGVGHGPGSR